MQERVHKVFVRKTDRQIQATPLHSWFKLLFQQGTELCQLHLTPCTWPGALHLGSSAHTGHHVLAFPPWDGADQGTPSLCPAKHMNLTFHCPYQGEQSRAQLGAVT